MPALLAALIALAFIAPARSAQKRQPRAACIEVRDPGVGTYRICAPAPRRR